MCFIISVENVVCIYFIFITLFYFYYFVSYFKNIFVSNVQLHAQINHKNETYTIVINATYHTNLK